MSFSTALPPMKQLMVCQHQRDHRLDYRDAADSDTWVMAALCHRFGLTTQSIDARNRDTDRAGRLERRSNHNRLSGRNATRNPTCMV